MTGFLVICTMGDMPPIDDMIPLGATAFISKTDHARLTAELEAAVATLPPDARLGASYCVATETWTPGTGQRLDELLHGPSMGFTGK